MEKRVPESLESATVWLVSSGRLFGVGELLGQSRWTASACGGVSPSALAKGGPPQSGAGQRQGHKIRYVRVLST